MFEKKLVFINGAMGVGKTTTCKILLERLTPGVWLDGDWCWNMNPFLVNDETTSMVLKNIGYLLSSYLQNSSFHYVIFSWVLHQPQTVQQILNLLTTSQFRLYQFTLNCSPKALTERLNCDIAKGLRKPEVVERSLGYLPLYSAMDTVKIEVSDCSPEQAALQIEEYLTA